MFRASCVSLALVLLAACDGAPTAAGPGFDTRWIPDASGEGNFQICLAEAEGHDLSTITLPARVLFRSWGPMTSSLLTANGPTVAPNENGTLHQFAVLTLAPAVLSADAPCARVPARLAIGQFGGTATSLPAEWHELFQPDGTLEIDDQFRTWPTHGPATPATDAMNMDLINATPVAAIANPVTLQGGVH
jgi:hypothetical protein